MKRLKYQEQDCELTLKQGLEEYLDHIGPEAKLTGDENNGLDEGYRQSVSYTHLTLPTIYSV